jgi:hypothetical protein
MEILCVENNIEMSFKETGCEDVDFTWLSTEVSVELLSSEFHKNRTVF